MNMQNAIGGKCGCDTCAPNRVRKVKAKNKNKEGENSGGAAQSKKQRRSRFG